MWLKYSVILALVLACSNEVLAKKKSGTNHKTDEKGVYTTTDPEPTAEETLILEFINRCRANPTADSLRMQLPSISSTKVDMKMFRREMAIAKSAPPVFFDLALIKAARRHCYYMICNDMTHIETKGKKGFTGKMPSDRLRAAGFNKGHQSSENCFRSAPTPWASHLGFVIDWGVGGTGGMQKNRGHRRNMLNTAYNLVGVGALRYSEGLSVSHNLAGTYGRYVGGVVYRDKNKNKFYDIGEGRGGVEFSADSQHAKSWSEGAYTLEIPSGDVELKVKILGKTYYRILPSGSENIKFDVKLGTKGGFSKPTALWTKYNKVPDGEKFQVAKKKALVNFYMASCDALLTKETLKAFKSEVVEEVAKEISQSKEIVEKSLAGSDLKAMAADIKTPQVLYSGTLLANWFKEATQMIRVRKSEIQLAAQSKKGTLRAKSVASKIKSISKLNKKLKEKSWKKYLSTVISRLSALSVKKKK